MANRDILAIGTSAGGVEALRFLAKQFHAQLPASVLVTIHLPSHARSVLDAVLSEAGPLPAQFASDGDVLKKGRIYIAPPNRHLIVDGHRLALGEGARENHARPAIDPMLRSAAVFAAHERSAWCSRGRWATALRACGRSSEPAAFQWCKSREMRSSRKCRSLR